MSKIFKFIKSNNFIKGVIFLIIGDIALQFSSLQFPNYILYSFLTIGFILFAASFVFFILSAIKENIWFKIFSVFFLMILIFIVGGSIYSTFQVLYPNKGLEQQLNQCLDTNKTFVNQEKQNNVTSQYTSCLSKYSDSLTNLNVRSTENLSQEQWIQLQKDYLKTENTFSQCLNRLFLNKYIYIY